MHENIRDKIKKKKPEYSIGLKRSQDMRQEQQKQGCVKRNDGFILSHLTSNDEVMPPKLWNEMFFNLEFVHIPTAN